jgi:3-hydroxyacyl-CoA dehydrogenase
MQNPSPLLIGHPFNPPRWIPLVEVCAAPRDHTDAIEDAMTFYRLTAGWETRFTNVHNTEFNFRNTKVLIADAGWGWHRRTLLRV